MSKHVKLDIEKLYEKHIEGIKMQECTFDSNIECCEDCPFYGWTCKMMDWLENLPTIEVSKDCISREDAIKALRLEYPSMPLFKELKDEWQLKTEGYRTAEEIIKNAPSVVPSRAEDE